MNPFNRDAIERLSAAQDEPGWMTALRLKAWSTYESSGGIDMPLDSFQSYAEPPRAAVPSENWPEDLKYVVEERGDEEGLIIQRDSTVLSRSITKDQTKRGTVYTDLSTALRQKPELVQRYFGRQIKGDDPFSALNTAFWFGGTFLYVPEHVQVQLPFHTCHWMTTPHTAIFPRSLIVAERGSVVTFVDDFLSVDWDQDTLAVSAAELFIAEQAKVTYKQLHHWGRGVRHENRQSSSVASSGKLESTYLSDARMMHDLQRVSELYPEVRI